jgi:hypothetical protein
LEIENKGKNMKSKSKSTKASDMISFEMETIAARHMLKWQVGQKIFCDCGKVLDCRESISLDVYRDGKIAKAIVLCTDCGDIAKERAEKACARHGLTMEIIDGRNLWPNKKRKSKSAPRALSETFVFGIFAGYRETSGNNKVQQMNFSDERKTSTSALRAETKKLFNTRAVSIKTIWKKETSK